jgi:hypothetical protein
VNVNEQVRQALARDRVIDITTTGRTSGLPRRIETWFFRVNGARYLTGTPGRRDWYANLLATPEFMFHLKRSAQADLAARAKPIVDEAQRRQIFTQVLRELGHVEDLEKWVAGSPLVEVELDG